MGGTRLPGEVELLQTFPALGTIDPAGPTKMPLESRMYGIFAGFLMTWGLALVSGRGRAVLMPPAWMVALFAAFITIMGFDGTNATMYDLSAAGLPIPYLYAPRLDLRLVTGLLCGIAMGGIILPGLNFGLWRDRHATPIFSDLRDLATLLVWNAIIFCLIVSDSGLFFLPVSLFGVLGVIALIGALNLIWLLSLLRPEGAAVGWKDTLNPFGAAVFLTAVELGALSLLRYAVLGTAILP